MFSNNELNISNSPNGVFGASSRGIHSNGNVDSIIDTDNILNRGSSINDTSFGEDSVSHLQESDGEEQYEDLDDDVDQIVSEFGLIEGMKMAMDTGRWGLMDTLIEMSNIMRHTAIEHPLEDIPFLVSVVGLWRLLDLASDNPFMREQFLLLRQMEDEYDLLNNVDYVSEYGLFEGIKMTEDTGRWGLRDELFERRDLMQQTADEHPLSDLEDLVSEVGLRRLLDLASDNPFMREQFLLLRQMEDAWNVTSDDLLCQHGLFKAIEIASNNRYMCGHYDDLMEIMDYMQQVANEHPPEVEDMSHLVDFHGFERSVEFAFGNPFMEKQLDLLSLMFSWSVTPESMIEKYGVFGALLTTFSVKYMDNHRDDIMSEVNRRKSEGQSTNS